MLLLLWLLGHGANQLDSLAMVASANAGSLVQNVCYLCKRKFPGADLLKRHERLSDLHRQNLEKQDELTQQRKDELRIAMHSLRQQINEADNALSEQVLSEGLQNQRTVLEMQLRQLLGEYSQAQEMIEDSRNTRSPEKPGIGTRKSLDHEVRVGRLAFAASVASWQGNKDVQEDRHMLEIELESPEGHPIVGFCVLDGHSGSLCVDQMVDRLPANLQKCISTKPSLTEEHLAQAVVEACVLTDDEFLHKARESEVLDGSTLILCLIFPDDRLGATSSRTPGSCRMLIANVGDSRAVLCRAAVPPGADTGEPRLLAMRLSEDHKPGRPDEQRRIEAKGGVVDLQGVWRVFTPGPSTFGGRVISRWGLAVSRAFGDLLLKEPERYGCAGVAPGGLITAVPEIRVVDLQPNEDRFLILACDGIWDVLTDDESVAVCSSQAGTELASLALVRRSFAAGSDDNLTALVVTWRQIE